MPRFFTCAMCSREGQSGDYGPLRKYCDTCRVNRHTTAAARSAAKYAIERGRRIRTYDPDYVYNRSLVTNYGINREIYDEMGNRQGWVCAICAGPPLQGNGNRLVVDHCHRTGKVRALLCARCNKGIGHLKDDPDLVRKALMYLEKHSV